MRTIDPEEDAYVASVRRTNLYIAIHNVMIVWAAGAVMGIAAAAHEGPVAVLALLIPWTTRSFVGVERRSLRDWPR